MPNLELTIQYIEKEISLLRELHLRIPSKGKDSDKLFVIFYLLTATVIESCETISVLIKKNKLRDSFMISRSVFEQCVNIGYLSCSDSSIVDRAYNHALSKTYRDLRRNVEFGDIKLYIGLSEDVEVVETERLKKSLVEFTNDKGEEIREWTKDNLSKRIKIINERYGEGIAYPFTMCFYFIYRHSSEILHGTIFGAMFERGMTEPRHDWPNNQEELALYRENKLLSLAKSLILLISCVVSIIGEHIDIGNLKKENHNIISEYLKLLIEN